MSIAEIYIPGIDPIDLADLQAVLMHVHLGTPVESELARRVEARSERITEELHRKYGQLNVAVELLRQVRDEG